MIKILIADDSQTETELLKQIFSSQPDMEVIACAKNGREACELTAKIKPDIITMDIQMPIMDGLEAIQRIMSHHPTPIVVISSKANDDSLNLSFNALAVGALSVLEKPIYSKTNFDQMKKRLLDTVRSMSEIKVVKRRFHIKKSPMKLIRAQISHEVFQLIAIGTSVGGPQVLRQILSKLPADFPMPIMIVQHMTPGFMQGFVKWLNENILLTAKVADNLEILRSGVVYFAPDGLHLEVDRCQHKLIARLKEGKPVAGFCPSATVLLKSVAKTLHDKSIGILLTGMGSDGAEGLLEIKKAHGHTLIQDPESAIVFGMAGVAQSLGAVDKVIEIDKIAPYLVELTKSMTEKA